MRQAGGVSDEIQPALFPGKPLDALVTEARDTLAEAIDRIQHAGKRVVGIVGLYSGGNDSTTLAHLFRGEVTHFGHANTGVGIEATRQFVRDTCAGWDVPLLEQRLPEGQGYRDLVLGRVLSSRGETKGMPVFDGGFPGPAMHWLMYQRLKERSLRRIRARLVSDGRNERVVFLAGRRRQESERRKSRFGSGQLRPIEREGSVVWVSPLINWGALDMNAYRRANPDVPRNEVSDLLHMSGECLCGAFAQREELDEIESWFPDDVAPIRKLEREAVTLGGVPPERCQWGWGADREAPSRVGRLCSSCPSRFQGTLFGDAPAA